MKVIHLNHSDINGGAARATYRIHRAFLKNNIDSRLWVNNLISGDWTVEDPINKFEKILTGVKPRIVSNSIVKTLKTKNPIIHSPSFFSSSWVKRINQSDADIIHLHWIQGEMLSIRDISKIKKPIVWTPQDMWVFSGAEHYTEDYRWRDGYNSNNRPPYETGFDLNRWTWKRKMKHWNRSIQMVAPSKWLANCISSSALMSKWPVSIIPNTIDTNFWKPMDKTLARQQLNLPDGVPLLLFGAIGGGSDPRKGFDLLSRSLEKLRDDPNSQKLELIIFGQDKPKVAPELGFPIHYMGKLRDDLSLRILYNSADMMLIPSRQDNLPNTGVEAHACAVPVVAFNTGGLPDIVKHNETGYLAKAFDTEDFANGIVSILSRQSQSILGGNARERAIAKFSEKKITTSYLKIYEKILDVS